MKIYSFLLFIIFLIITNQSKAQVDTNTIRKFVEAQQPFENEFIAAIKKGDINKGLMFVSDAVKNEMGEQALVAQISKMYSYFKKYPKPTITNSIGLGLNGVGTFGHDVNGSIELSSNYRFSDKKLKTLTGLHFFIQIVTL